MSTDARRASTPRHRRAVRPSCRSGLGNPRRLRSGGSASRCPSAGACRNAVARVYACAGRGRETRAASRSHPGRLGSQAATTRATPSARCSTKPLPSTWRPGLTWPAQDNSIGQADHHTPKAYVRQAFRKYLQCGIFAHGFARMQHAAHGGGSSAPERSCFSASAGAPVGAVGAKAAALLHAARGCPSQDAPRGRSRKSLFVYGQGLAWRLGITARRHITRSGHPIQAFQAPTDRSPAASEVAAGIRIR